MNRDKKYLVTGATGFVGLEVVKQLCSEGLSVKALVRRPLRGGLLSQLNTQIIQGDLSSPESLKRACEGVDIIIHLGARAIFEEYNFVKPTIVDGSKNLMDAAIGAGVERFIYSSSLLVYDSQTNPIDGNTPLNPRCGYGEAKVESEKLLSEMAIKSGVSIAIIRLPHVYGARDLMFEDIRKGRVFQPGNGRNTFAHLHVEDAANILVNLSKSRWEGTSAVGDYSSVNWIEYFKEIKKYYPRFRCYSIPQPLALFATWCVYPFRLLHGEPSIYTSGSVISWNLNLPVKHGLFWDETGLTPKYPTIYEGIPATLDACIPFQWIPSIKDRL